MLDSYRLKHLTINNWDEEEEMPLTLSSLPLTIEFLTLEGSFSNLTNNTFQRLSNLQSLDLCNIETLTDVSWFSKLRSLQIQSCPNVTDITSLQDNYEISIRLCSGIIDYRHSFSNSQIILIGHPVQGAIIDLQHFKKVKKLYLESKDSYTFSLPKRLTKLKYNGGIHFETFVELFELEITYSSSKITNVELFGNITKLRLTNLVNLISLSGLGYDEDSSKKLRNRSVELRSCANVKDFHYLKKIPSVSIVYCNHFNISNVEELKNVKNLSLSGCQCLENMMKIDINRIEMNNEELTLEGFLEEGDLFFGNFGGVKRLDIRRLSFHKDPQSTVIQSLNGLENLKNLERFALSNNWIECESIGWKILKEDFNQFQQKNHSFYLRKTQNN